MANKVLIVSFYYTPEIGAAASRIGNMAEGLQRQGLSVDVLTCLPNYPRGRIFEGYRGCYSKKEVINGINIYRYWTYATVARTPLARLLGMAFFILAIWVFGLKVRLIRKYDHVVIQSPPLPVAYFATLLFRCLYRKHTVLNVSDLWPESAVELGAVKRGSLYYKVLYHMERFVYRHNTAYQGQSQEIVDHVNAMVPQKLHFLYRNLQPHSVATTTDSKPRQPLKLVYAGLFGVAQDILGMIQAIDFKACGAELHLYGGGNQVNAINDYLATHDCAVVNHGYVSKEQINRELSLYHASIVPLAVRIKGAVPSKIFDLLPHGVPILFCGGGEGEQIVAGNHLGLTSKPGDYEALRNNICTIASLSDADYEQMRRNCLTAAENEFNFDSQMVAFRKFLDQV
jgi:glycosyltransferase involved in cell wall biosynthesis